MENSEYIPANKAISRDVGETVNALYKSLGPSRNELLSEVKKHALFVAREWYKDGINVVQYNGRDQGIPVFWLSKQIQDDLGFFKQTDEAAHAGRFTAHEYALLLAAFGMVRTYNDGKSKLQHYVPVSIL